MFYIINLLISHVFHQKALSLIVYIFTFPRVSHVLNFIILKRNNNMLINYMFHSHGSKLNNCWDKNEILVCNSISTRRYDSLRR